MDKVIFFVIAMGFSIGLYNYIFNKDGKIADNFKEGINNMGSLSLGMIGILSLTPIIENFLIKLDPLFNKFGIEISTIISTFIAIDMGAYVFGGQLAYVVAVDKEAISIYIVFKLVCGILSLVLAFIITKNKKVVVN